MFLVSSPEMALAACRNGIIGSFPAHATRDSDDFEQWLITMEKGVLELKNQGIEPAPYAVNLVVHGSNKRYQSDLAICIKHNVEIILTSKGAPGDAIKKIHEYGGIAFHDVASKRHAEKALQAGVDGLIAVCGGAGGHTGTINPFALTNEIREITDKPIILSGALSTGRDILTAQTMGASMAYMGTRFIACTESLASDDYRNDLLESSAKDIFLTSALDGFPANFLSPGLIKAGFDLDELAYTKPGAEIDEKAASLRYKSIWLAGHGVGTTKKQQTTSDVCSELIQQYQQAKDLLKREMLHH